MCPVCMIELVVETIEELFSHMWQHGWADEQIRQRWAQRSFYQPKPKEMVKHTCENCNFYGVRMGCELKVLWSQL